MNKRLPIAAVVAAACAAAVSARADVLITEPFDSLSGSYTTHTSNGGTVGVSGGMLNVDIGTANPTGTSYLSRTDGIGSSNVSGTAMNYGYTADINVSRLTFTLRSAGGNTTEPVVLFQVMPSTGSVPVNKISLIRSDFNNNMQVNMTGGIHFTSGTGTASSNIAISQSSYNTIAGSADPVLHFSVAGTLTNTSGLNWTNTATLTVTNGANTLGTFSFSRTGAASNSTFNPLIHDNTIGVGNVSHSRSDVNQELFGGMDYVGYTYSVSAVPEPAALALLGTSGFMLITRRRRS